MIIFIITDMDGEAGITDNLLKRLTVRNDVMVVSINDAYLTGSRLFDLENNSYEKQYMLHDKRIHEAEVIDRKKRLKKIDELYKRYMVSRVEISKKSEIVDKIVELFDKHKNESIAQ